MKLRLGYWLLSILFLAVGCVPLTPPPVPPTRTPTTAPALPPTHTLAPLPTDTPMPPPVHLVLWESLPSDQSGVLAGDIEAFETEYPYITVEVRHYQDTPTLLETLSAADEEAFHLALGNAALVAGLQARDVLQPLGEQLPAQFLESFVYPAIASASRDGHVWGLPDTAGMHLLLFYNRDMIAVPPGTTEELTELAQSFTGKGRWGVAMNSYDPLWVVPWLWPYGGWLTDGEGHPTLDTVAMVDALTLYMSWHGRLTGVAPLVTYDEARRLFLEGKVPMLIDGEWAIGELGQAKTVNWDVAPLPVVGDTQHPAAPLIGGRYWVTRRGLPPDESYAVSHFLSFVTSPERQQAWAERFGLLPTRQSALEGSCIMADHRLRASAQQMQAGRGLMLGVDANQLFAAMRGPLRYVLDGDMVPQDAARAMQAAVGGGDSGVGSKQ